MIIFSRRLLWLILPQLFITLDYSDGSYNAGLGWNGGNGGIAIYIEPPIYPCRIKSSRFYISANSSSVGFYAMIYDDDGPNGSHGTLLDSVFIPGTSVTTSAYNTVPTADTNLIIQDGGIYLLWRMDGSGINIGKDYDPPISRRTYEVLYQGWADYRDVQTEDFLMGINIENLLPYADFNISNNDPVFNFTDMSGKYPTSWSWDFGDGSASVSTQNAAHTFATNGSYNVCLAIANSYGYDTMCKTVNVYSVPPVADFSMDSTADPQIVFYDQTSNIATNWYWDFDDLGATSTVKNPTHAFILNGHHQVCMKVTNNGGADSICKSIYITNAPPVADFSIDSTNDPVIQFTGSALNNPTSWHWDFGDGSTSSLISPSHSYSFNGTYNVCLIISNSIGADTICKSVVVSHIKPVADFSMDTVLDPRIRFYDQSLNGPYAWYWDFGDNNAASTLPNATYIYPENGDYTVCLKATNNGGNDSICKIVTIRNVAPVSVFTYDDSQDPQIQFTDASLKKPTSWYWDFGNGDTSTAQNPLYRFPVNGSFNVCLTATNTGGNSKSCQLVTVAKNPPVADFSMYTPLDPKVIFTDLSTMNPTSWHWDFDDNGATSNLQSPTYTFTVGGNHNVCLTVTNPGGSDSVCKQLVINNIPPVADFSFDDTNDPLVVFTDESKNQPDTWEWDFDDNAATSTLQNPTYTFTTAGEHNVCLKVSKPAGFNTKCKKVTISNVKPVANFTVDSLQDPIFGFTDKSLNNPSSWFWRFGDGNTSTVQYPSHTYAENGQYSVWLVVENAIGKDSVSKSIYVKKNAPIAAFQMDTLSDPLINFIDESKNDPLTWKWTFGEDTFASVLQNPSFTYTLNALYEVCLTVTNDYGSDQFCKWTNIEYAVPIANFTYDSTTMPIVSFTDLSQNTPDEWSWDFDDNGATSSDKNPVYHFTADGVHNVCLIATNDGGASEEFCIPVYVTKTAIESIETNRFMIYPNPSSGDAYVLFLKQFDTDHLVINVYSTLGKKISLPYEVLSDRVKISAQHLSEGSYLIRIMDNDKLIGKAMFMIVK
jgi:PKD repeat protein